MKAKKNEQCIINHLMHRVFIDTNHYIIQISVDGRSPIFLTIKWVILNFNIVTRF